MSNRSPHNALMRICLFLAATLCAAFLACSPMYAGGGSDTEVSGRIVTSSGNGSAGVRVYLLPANYDPVFGGPVSTGDEALTDSNGSYKITNVKHGYYNLVASDSLTGSRLLNGNIGVAGNVPRFVLPDDSLRRPVRLVVNVPDSLVTRQGYVVAEGTSFYKRKNAGDTSATIDSMAQGLAPAIRFETSASQAIVLFTNVTVGPNDTTVLLFPGWLHSAKVHVNTSITGTPVSTGVGQFSVPVRLLAATFPFAQTRSGGADIRVASSGGKPLAFEIAQWDSASGQALVWVSLDTVYPNNADQYFRMYWGNGSVSAASNPRAVFDTGKGYAAVWHFEESQSGVGTPAVYKDATQNGNNGIDSVSSTVRTGFVGNAVTLAAGDKIVTNSPITDMALSPFTVCVWVNFSTKGGVVFSKTAKGLMADTGDKEFWFGDSAATGVAGFRPTLGTIGQGMLTAQRDMGVDQWHYYTFRWSQGAASFYIDGGLCGFTGAYAPISADNPISRFVIGSDGIRNFAGAIDELQISKTARSDTWIILSFEVQREGQHIVSVEIEK